MDHCDVTDHRVSLAAKLSGNTSRDRIANVLRDLGLPTGPATVRA